MTRTAHAIAYNFSKALRYRERIVIALAALIVLLAGAYIYFIREAIVNVVAREQVTKAIQADNVSVATLENQYFTLKSSITMNTAASLGFTPVAVAAFIPASLAVAQAVPADLSVPTVAFSSNDEN